MLTARGEMGMCLGTMLFAPSCCCGICCGKRVDMRQSSKQALAFLIAALALVCGGVFWYIADAKRCSDLAGPAEPCMDTLAGKCVCGAAAASSGGCVSIPAKCNAQTITCPDRMAGAKWPWEYSGTPCFSTGTGEMGGAAPTVVTFFGLGSVLAGLYWLGLARSRDSREDGSGSGGTDGSSISRVNMVSRHVV